MYRNKVYLMIASVIILHLLSSHVVLCDYETIWNAYFERPCCEKDFMKYHKGKGLVDKILMEVNRAAFEKIIIFKCYQLAQIS